MIVAESWSDWGRRKSILSEVEEERGRQLAKWGPQGHAFFAPEALCDTPRSYVSEAVIPETELVAEYYGLPTASAAKALCEGEHAAGDSSWLAILVEEMAEAAEEAALCDVTALRTELVQVAAVVVAWIEDLDRTATEEREAAFERDLAEKRAHHGFAEKKGSA